MYYSPYLPHYKTQIVHVSEASDRVMELTAISVYLHPLYRYVYGALTTCLLISVLCKTCILRRRPRATNSQDYPSAPHHGISIHKPQIIRCKISHHRLFPKRHNFTYSYLMVGVPVRSPSSNWLLSFDDSSQCRRGWLHVSTKDHLNRGLEGKTLSENLDAYLCQQV